MFRTRKQQYLNLPPQKSQINLRMQHFSTSVWLTALTEVTKLNVLGKKLHETRDLENHPPRLVNNVLH